MAVSALAGASVPSAPTSAQRLLALMLRIAKVPPRDAWFATIPSVPPASPALLRSRESESESHDAIQTKAAAAGRSGGRLCNAPVDEFSGAYVAPNPITLCPTIA
jgi:hypothetical protein